MCSHCKKPEPIYRILTLTYPNGSVIARLVCLCRTCWLGVRSIEVLIDKPEVEQ